jgi:protocatechuate 3,4-dioxygenase alpha subunit
MTVHLTPTASQTVGPFFQVGLAPSYVSRLAGDGVLGQRLSVRGRVLDGSGEGVPDALIEIWQADASGNYPARDSLFRGFGRVPTDTDGGFTFATIKPGRVPGPEGTMQAPHLLLNIFMRGLLRHLVTRIYFSDEPSNDEDAVLLGIAADRRPTLIAQAVPPEPGVFEWHVVLQGANETVFFDC